MEHECDGDTNCKWRTRYNHQRVDKGTGELGNKRTTGDHTNYDIVENTEESPGDWRRLVVTNIPVRNHQLT